MQKSMKSSVQSIEWPDVTKSVIAIGSAIPGYAVHKSLRKVDVSPFITIPIGIATSFGLTMLGCKIVDGVGSFIRVKTDKMLPCDVKAIMDAIHDKGVKEYCDHYNIDIKASVRNIDIDDLVMFYDGVTDKMCETFFTVKNESTVDYSDSSDTALENDEEVSKDNQENKEEIGTQKTSDLLNDDESVIIPAGTVVDPHSDNLE